MKFYRRILLVALLGLAGCSPALPEVGERALAQAQSLCEKFPARIAGESSRAAAVWIASQLPMGATLDDFKVADGRTLTNVIWQSQPNPAYLLISHYDTKAGIPGFVGANDGASTTGLLIELAKHFAQTPPRGGIACAFVDGEECLVKYDANDGLLGSTHLADTLRTRPPRATFVLDMLGDLDQQFQLADTGSSALNRQLRKAGAALGLSMGVSESLIDDHIPFCIAGMNATAIIDFEYGPEGSWWHTKEDSCDKLSAASLNTAGKLICLTLKQLEKEE